MKVLKVRKINYFKGAIIKIFSDDKKNFKIKEIYAVELKGKIKRHWRQHINCNKLLFCIEGKFKVEIINKMDNRRKGKKIRQR